MASSLGLYPFWRPLNKSDDDNDDDEAYAMTGEQREKAAVLHVSGASSLLVLVPSLERWYCTS